MKNILFLLLATILFSCSPEYRLKTLLKNHPELTKIDTIIRNDSIFIRSYQFDTVVRVSKDTINDTIYLSKEKIKLKLVYKDSLIYVNIERKGDTVINTDTVYVCKTDPNLIKTENIPFWKFCMYFFAFCFGCYVLSALFKMIGNVFKVSNPKEDKE